MKNLSVVSSGPNFTAVELGALDQLAEYTYLHPKLRSEVNGKVFTGEALQSTGVEISFQTLPPYAEIPFLHQHNRHEEVYVFLKGKGQFQVDGEIFDVQEGTLVRIAPEGARTWRNNSAEPLVFMVIQATTGSLAAQTVFDGFRASGQPDWEPQKA